MSLLFLLCALANCAFIKFTLLSRQMIAFHLRECFYLLIPYLKVKMRQLLLCQRFLPPKTRGVSTLAISNLKRSLGRGAAAVCITRRQTRHSKPRLCAKMRFSSRQTKQRVSSLQSNNAFSG